MSALQTPSAPLGSPPKSKVLPHSTPPGIHGDHHRRDDIGASVAGLVLGLVIQGGPRSRSNGRVPPPRRADLARRPAASVSCVDVDLRRSRPSGVAIRVRRKRVLVEATDPQLCRWENEGGRLADPPLGNHRIAGLFGGAR
jgi:hypothetical protein